MKLSHLFRIFLLRQKQHHTIPVQDQVKIFQITCVLDHIAVIVILKSANAV